MLVCKKWCKNTCGHAVHKREENVRKLVYTDRILLCWVTHTCSYMYIRPARLLVHMYCNAAHIASYVSSWWDETAKQRAEGQGEH